MIEKLICITCPRSCRLIIQVEGTEIQAIEGNGCPRGYDYACDEILHPVRMLTSTVVIKNALYSRLPVVSSRALPKEKIREVMIEINKCRVFAPIQMGDVILKDVCGLGIDIISSRSMEVISQDDLCL